MLRTEAINIPLSQTRLDTKNNRRVLLCSGAMLFMVPLLWKTSHHTTIYARGIN